MDSPNPNRSFYLPRLPREYYQGDSVTHWTLSINRRQTGWLNESFHNFFRETMLHTAAREGLICPVYCLMPDHIHLVWMGLSLNTDQLNGMAFLRTHLKSNLMPAKFQHQAHDHVLKEEERHHNAFALVCNYILMNPVEKSLSNTPIAWPYNGCVVPGYPDLHPLQDDFWNKCWKIYNKLRQPDSGNLSRPPRS